DALQGARLGIVAALRVPFALHYTVTITELTRVPVRVLRRCAAVGHLARGLEHAPDVDVMRWTMTLHPCVSVLLHQGLDGSAGLLASADDHVLGRDVHARGSAPRGRDVLRLLRDLGVHELVLVCGNERLVWAVDGVDRARQDL